MKVSTSLEITPRVIRDMADNQDEMAEAWMNFPVAEYAYECARTATMLRSIAARMEAEKQ